MLIPKYEDLMGKTGYHDLRSIWNIPVIFQITPIYMMVLMN
jgi:hypothetical protein